MAFGNPSANQAIDNIVLEAEINNLADTFNNDARVELPRNALVYRVTLRAHCDMNLFENFALQAGVDTRVTLSESQLGCVAWHVPQTTRKGTVDLSA